MGNFVEIFTVIGERAVGVLDNHSKGPQTLKNKKISIEIGPAFPEIGTAENAIFGWGRKAKKKFK